MKNERRQIKDRENEETKSRLQERKKVERDEMAARHLQREKSKTPGVRYRYNPLTFGTGLFFG